MILSNTKKIGLWSTCWLFVLGPVIGVTYALYALVYWMMERGLPRAVILFPIGLIFAVVNVAHNWIVCTILFRELPQEFFTTARLKRWKQAEDNSPRRELADLLGGFLNARDDDHY